MQTTEATTLYRDGIVVDCLNGSALKPSVIARLREAGVTAVNLTAVEIGHDFADALKDLAMVTATIRRHADALLLARTPDDVQLAKRTNRTAIILGLQDAEPIERDLSRLSTLYDLGVRIIQLTHNRQNYVGTGCAERDSGLTRFGRSVVEEMNRLGLMVDLSHCGPRTTMETIEVSAAPVTCSHSNPRAISPSPRNKEDAIIAKLAERSGLIGIAFWSPIVYRGTGKRPGLADVLDCFDHAITLAGPARVAIGTDICEDAQPDAETWARIYGPQGQYPEVTAGLGDWYGFKTMLAQDLETVTSLPSIAQGLLARGHKAPAVRGILGENFLDFWRRVIKPP